MSEISDLSRITEQTCNHVEELFGIPDPTHTVVCVLPAGHPVDMIGVYEAGHAPGHAFVMPTHRHRARGAADTASSSYVGGHSTAHRMTFAVV